MVSKGTNNKKCNQCGQNFGITAEDKNFLEEISPVFNGKKFLIPLPKICYECSFQRKLVFKNERNLYYRKSDCTGKQLISIYSPDKPYKVWENKIWQSDKLDAEQYGMAFDEKIPLFDQLDQLYHQVPHRHILQIDAENSDFCSDVDHGKNQYMCFMASHLNNCLYVHDSIENIDCVDCFLTFNSELCYEANASHKIYNSKYIFKSKNISDSAFIYNSQNLKHCFFCFNMKNKSYCAFNRQLTEKEYFREVAKWDLGSHKTVETLKHRFFQDWSKFPVKNLNNQYVENSTGDLNESIKDSINCFDSVTTVEKCKDSANFWTAYNCWRIYGSGKISNSYEAISSRGDRLLFDFETVNCEDVLYSLMCKSCKHLIACVGLRNKEYCILNTQYSKEEYEILAEKIIRELEKSGQWGEFFPMNLSPFGYNESRAHQWYPLEQAAAKKLGAKWKEKEQGNFYQGTAPKTPDNIKDCTDEWKNKILACESCGSNFQIIEKELSYYKKHNISLPRSCFRCRYESRLKFKPPAKLWKRPCAKCRQEMLTSYSPDRPEKVYCENCYLNEVY